MIDSILLKGRNGTKKLITFEKDGRINIPQKRYFNELFNDNLSVKTNYNEFAYFGAFRCAKSFSEQAAVYLLGTKYRNLRVLYVRDTYDQLTSSVIPQFNKEFEMLGNYEYAKSYREAVFTNKSHIYFRAFNYDTDILSAEYDVIAGCQIEDIPEELFLQFFGRMSGKILPRPLLLVEGNPSNNYVKTRYKDRTTEELKAKGIFFVQGKTKDNPHVTEAYIQRLYENYPKF